MGWLKCAFFIFLALIVCSGCNTQILPVKPNPYGLTVVSGIREYQNSIKKDAQKQLVSLNNYLINVKYDWKYATINNFTQQVLYKNPLACLRIPAALALQQVEIELNEQGMGLIIYDAYRPYSITQKMWEIVPDERYTANPARGSYHNRGAAVDVSLYNLQTGEPLPMPTPFDDFSEKAHHGFMQLPQAILKNREILKNTMTKYGFLALSTEWWHYYLPSAATNFELLDIDFRQMSGLF